MGSKRADYNFVDKVARNNIWITPPDEVDLVHRYAPIGLDPCTEPNNPTRAAVFFTEEDDGLVRDWTGYGPVFVNPPYSTFVDLDPTDYATKEEHKQATTEAKREYLRELKDRGEGLFGLQRGLVTSLIVLWVTKIHLEVSRGAELIALLPCGARFSTAYWQDHVLIPEMRAMCFPRGRIRFVDGRTGKPGKGNNYDSQYLGFNVDDERFREVFSSRGRTTATGWC